MNKGTLTKQAILGRSADLARRVGLEGLSIGRLSREVGMSKSGLFAHFGSKESLQVETLLAEAGSFVDSVVRPALKAPRGEPRIEALIDLWTRWVRDQGRAGCIFVTASIEFDDQPGAVRDVVAHQQNEWIGFLAESARRAVAEGHFREDLDPQQFAYEFYSLLLGYHHAKRMMHDPKAEERIRIGFERLLAASHPKGES